MKLELDEVRRLTGPNLLSDSPGAIVDVLLDGIDQQRVVESWRKWVHQFMEDLEWPALSAYRLHSDGASMAIAAPFDALYSACEIAELAWKCTCADILDEPDINWELHLSEIRSELEEEQNPDLLSILSTAEARGVSCLTDDDELSLGMGETSKVWPVADLPSAESIDWASFDDIPTAFITGTNGKSTSVRLAAEIGKEAGLNAGVTSTDFIKVGDDIIEYGDYSGPGGARMLLRDSRTQIAFLEVARGGMLRRGLPVAKVDAALITNVASDHLGQYGINTVDELAQAKFIVAKGLGEKSILVVNADNKLVVQQASLLDNPLCWFSVDEKHSLIQQQIHNGGKAVFVRAGHIVFHSDGLFEEIAMITKIPMTFNGTARHNIENALGVVGLCRALKISFQAIRSGLMRFGSDAQDNPGRGNQYRVNGSTVIVDFAHNEHSMRAVVGMVKSMPANNRIVMFGHAGDRSDKDIRDLTNAVVELQAQHYIISELEDYLRGRDLGDIPAVVQAALAEQGVEEHDSSICRDPLSGAKHALSLAAPGDVILLFVLDQRELVHEWLTGQDS